MPEESRPGRTCPLRYRYVPETFDRAPALSAHTAYVIGGLYGNREALDTILAMAALERRRGIEVTLVFNGDFHWLDVGAADFAYIDETVLHHVAIQGNVEAELAGVDSGAGCGCAYPDYVEEAVVTRSNEIMARLRATVAPFPALRSRLAELPMTLTLEVAGARVGILHGDPESLAGWGFAVEAMPPAVTTSAARIRDYFRRARVRVFACTHTGLPHARRFEVDGRAHLVVNNGAAGMPNISHERFGVITRLSGDPRVPEASLYGIAIEGLRVDALPVRYDHAAWLERFFRDWPEGSPAYLSYHRRLTEGPAFTLAEAAPPGLLAVEREAEFFA